MSGRRLSRVRPGRRRRRDSGRSGPGRSRGRSPVGPVGGRGPHKNRACFTFPRASPFVKLFGSPTEGGRNSIRWIDTRATVSLSCRELPEDADDHRVETAAHPRTDPARDRAHRGPGLHPAPEPGGVADDHRRHRRRGQAAGPAAPGDPRRRAGGADPQSRSSSPAASSTPRTPSSRSRGSRSAAATC